jgi:hypothetical protein
MGNGLWLLAKLICILHGNNVGISVKLFFSCKISLNKWHIQSLRLFHFNANWLNSSIFYNPKVTMIFEDLIIWSFFYFLLMFQNIDKTPYWPKKWRRNSKILYKHIRSQSLFRNHLLIMHDELVKKKGTKDKGKNKLFPIRQRN